MSTVNYTSNKIQMVKGDSRRFDVEIKDEITGLPKDLTSYGITMTCRKSNRDPSVIFTKRNDLAGGSINEINVYDPTNGKFYMYFKKADTITLQFQGNDYVYDIRIVNGDDIKTPIISTMKLIDGVNQT